MTENNDLTTDDVDQLEIRSESPKRVLEIRDREPHLALHGHDTESGNEADLCCSECGEVIEVVVTQQDSEILRASIPQIEGFVCGCSETPKTWAARSIGSGTESSD